MLTKNVSEYSWKTAQGVDIYAVQWDVDKPRAVVGLIHGLGEHCRRYDHLGHFFQTYGVAMIGYDRQGYGRSGGRKGYAKDFGYYLDTISKLVVECETKYPDTPVYLYGHSLGGGLLLNYLIDRHPNITGAICSAAFIRPGFPPPAVKVALGKVMRSVWPSFTQNAQLELNHLSRSEGIASAYAADPYTHHKLSAATGVGMLDMGERLDQYNGTINLPLLLMHGSDDQLTAHAGSKAFSERVKGDDITFKSWSGFYHELHNEPEQKEVMNFVLNWMDARISGKA